MRGPPVLTEKQILDAIMEMFIYCTMYFPKTELHFLAEVPLINDQNTKTFFAAIFIRMTSQIQS